MADILRITTPLISKNTAQLQQKQPGTGELFSLDEPIRVVKTNPQSEMLMQNNAMVEKDSSVPVYVNLLTNPNVMNGYTSSILLLQEVIGLLPLNSKTVTPEIQQMFDSLFVLPDDVVSELIRQERSSSVFKGDFFDFIRSVLKQDSSRETLYAALRMIKCIDEPNINRKALSSVINYLKYLSSSLSPSKELSAKLSEFSDNLRGADMIELLSLFNNDIIPLFNEIESSLLYDEKTEKLLSLIIHNLSRFSHNPDAIAEVGEQFVGQLESDEQKLEFIDLLKSVLTSRQHITQADVSEMEQSPDYIAEASGAGNAPDDLSGSKVMDTLTTLIGKECENENLSDTAKSRLGNIIYSLLSSPSNFTPLLHYILPLYYENIRAYAEIWINPNSAEEAELAGERPVENSIHFLIVFDVDGIGQFEAELFVRGHTIDFMLLCPEEHVSVFSNMGSVFRESIRSSDYRFDTVKFDKLERRRSIVEVFTSLPYRRMGIDITI